MVKPKSSSKPASKTDPLKSSSNTIVKANNNHSKNSSSSQSQSCFSIFKNAQLLSQGEGNAGTTAYFPQSPTTTTGGVFPSLSDLSSMQAQMVRVFSFWSFFREFLVFL
jgi:hypothetical protein